VTPHTSVDTVSAWTSILDGVTHGVDGGASGIDIGRTITVGTDGSIYVAGFLRSESVGLGELTVSRVGIRDAFVAKLTADGDPVWFTGIGGSGAQTSINGIAVTADAEVVVVGEFLGSIGAGSWSLTSVGGSQDGFVARLDADGIVQWATRLGGSGVDTFNDVAVAADGSLVAGGVAVGTVTIGSTQSTSPWNDTANDDGILARFDTTGTVRDVTRVGGAGDDALVKLAVSVTGTIVTTGASDTAGTVQVRTPTDTHTATGAHGLTDIIVISLELTGAVNWSQVLGGSGDDLGQGLVIDSDGRVTVAGHGNPPFTVGGTSHPSSTAPRSDDDIVLSQFTPDGVPLWTDVTDNGSSTDDGVRHLALGPEDRLVTVGHFGPNSSAAARFASIIHDSSGNLLRGPYLLGNLANQIGQGAVVTESGDLLLTGRFAGGPVDPVDPTRTLATTGGSDIVVIRIAGALQSSQTITFAAPADRPFSPTPFALSPTTDAAGLSITLTSTTADVCTVTALEVTTVATGTCTLTASQAGERHYMAASPITHSFTVTSANQAITFPAPADRELTSSPFALSPTTDASGLSVTLTSDTPDTCTVTGLEITMVATGTCTLTASQAGDARYSAATAVTRSFSITSPTTIGPTTTTPTTTTPSTTAPTSSEPAATLPSTGFTPEGSTFPFLVGGLGALVALAARRRA
jgi:hypothetical protein